MIKGFGWRYKDGSRLFKGDSVIVSQSAAKKCGTEDRRGTVVDAYGFVTVRLLNGVEIDLDMRSITKG